MKYFWAKIGQNWPKCAIRIMRILRSRTCRRARGLIFHHFIRIKISWGSAEEIVKIQPTVVELSVKNLFPIVNANPKIPGLTAVCCTNVCLKVILKYLTTLILFWGIIAKVCGLLGQVYHLPSWLLCEIYHHCILGRDVADPLLSCHRPVHQPSSSGGPGWGCDWSQWEFWRSERLKKYW